MPMPNKSLLVHYAARLADLRAELAAQGLDGFVIPISDEHMSEYVGAYAQRLEWLTGFGGSAGTAVVLRDKAAIFVDGRYTLQVRDQVDGYLYEYHNVPATSPAAWAAENAPQGAKIGYDAWLHGRPWARGMAKALGAWVMRESIIFISSCQCQSLNVGTLELASDVQIVLQLHACPHFRARAQRQT